MSDYDELKYITMIDKRVLLMHYVVIIILALACIIFISWIIFSNRIGRGKKKTSYSYLTLYREIRLLGRKYKKTPIIVSMNDKLYKCKFKYKDDILTIIPQDECSIEEVKPPRKGGKKDEGNK